MYNAWLAQLIERGQVTGLWLDSRWNNVLFDLLVSGLGNLFSLQVTEKIAVSVCVLIFFWGTFALVAAASKRAPWFLVPLLAMIAYGYTFHMGFFNYYLSLGLSFFGIAIFWRGKKWEKLIPLALAPLIVLAHPLGLAWMAGAIVYIAIDEAIPTRYQPVLLFLAASALVLIHFDFWRHYEIMAQSKRFYFFNGSDQLSLFGPRYDIPRIALICFAIAALAIDIYGKIRKPEDFKQYAVPAQLYIVLILAAWLLPDAIRFRPGNSAILALLTERLTSVSAVVFCCVLGDHAPALVALAWIHGHRSRIFHFYLSRYENCKQHGTPGRAARKNRAAEFAHFSNYQTTGGLAYFNSTHRRSRVRRLLL